MLVQVRHYCASIHKSKVYFNNSFSYDAPKLWNDLPYDLPYDELQISRVSKVDLTLPILEIIPTISSNYQTPDRLPGYDLEHV